MVQAGYQLTRHKLKYISDTLVMLAAEGGRLNCQPGFRMPLRARESFFLNAIGVLNHLIGHFFCAASLAGWLNNESQ